MADFLLSFSAGVVATVPDVSGTADKSRVVWASVVRPTASGNGEAQGRNAKRRESVPKPALALIGLRSSADVWILFAFGLLFPGQLLIPHLSAPALDQAPDSRRRIRKGEGYLDDAPTVCLI